MSWFSASCFWRSSRGSVSSTHTNTINKQMMHSRPQHAKGTENGTFFRYGIFSISPWSKSSGSER